MKIIMSIIILYSSYLFGRGPAIEPTFGISIENQKIIRPDKAKGFNFSTEINQNDYGTLEKSKLEELIVLLILLVSLPLFFFIFLNLNKKRKSDDQYLEILENYPKNIEEEKKKAS
jgi:hypothetical protein